MSEPQNPSSESPRAGFTETTDTLTNESGTPLPQAISHHGPEDYVVAHPWPVEKPSDNARTATEHENRRWTRTTQRLGDFGLAKYHTIDVATSIGPLFAIMHSAPDLLTEIKGIGDNYANQFPSPGELESYDPDGWSISSTITPASQLMYEHNHSRTTVSITETGPNKYITVLRPADFPENQVLLLTPPEGYKGKDALKILDTVMTVTDESDTNCYIHSSSEMLEEQLTFKTPRPTPNSFPPAQTDKNTTTLLSQVEQQTARYTR